MQHTKSIGWDLDRENPPFLSLSGSECVRTAFGASPGTERVIENEQNDILYKNLMQTHNKYNTTVGNGLETAYRWETSTRSRDIAQ